MKRPTIRCSELDRVLSCNGSLELVPRVDPRDFDEGDEGKYLHWLTAKRLIDELGATPPDGGLPPPDVPQGYKCPKNSLWIVNWNVRRVREAVTDGWSLLVEVPLAYSFGSWTLSGHPDWIAISPDGTEAIAGDFKTGRDPVDPADNNWQVFGYEVLLKRAWVSLEKITFEIDQPRVSEEDGFERISTSVIEGDDLKLAAQVLHLRVCAAIENRMELNSGKKQCAWCPVAVQCPALLAELDIMKMNLTPASIEMVKAKPSDRLLGLWVTTMRTLARPAEDALELLHARLDEVPEVVAGDGMTITRTFRGGKYEILEPVEFYKAAKNLLVTDERMAAVFTPAMGRMVDEVAAALDVPKTGKEPVTAQGVVDSQLKPFTQQKQNRLLHFR